MTGDTGFDIAVVGLGTVIGSQLTPEVAAAIAASETLFTLDNGYGVDPRLNLLCDDVRGLEHFYEEGGPRRSTYRSMAATVVAEAMDGGPVTFATYGHPRIYCYPATLTLRAAELLDLRTLVLPGVSALDELLVDVGYDPSAGLQTFDASDLLYRQRRLAPDVACVLWQTTWAMNPNYRAGRAPYDSFLDLQSYLSQFYPADHLVLEVFSRTHPALRSRVLTHSIGRLAEALASGLQSGTLFIPAIRDDIGGRAQEGNDNAR